MYSAVIDPLSELPARSMSRGSVEKTGGRKAAPGGRFARGKTDLALGAAEARHRVHHEHHALALIAEIFGHGRGRVRGLQPFHGGTVRGGDDQHGLFPAFRSQVVLDELPDFAAAFADQGQHAHVRRAALDDRGQKRTLAAACRRRKYPALPLAAGQHAVDHAQPERHGPVDDLSEHGIGRVRVDGIMRAGLQRRTAVHRLAQPVENPPEQIFAHGHGMHLAGGNDFRGRRHALQIPQRGQQRHLLDEAHHLGPQRPVLPRVAQDAQLADLHPGHHGPDDRAYDLLHPPRISMGEVV